MLRIRSFALVSTALLLTAALSQAAPPGGLLPHYVSPPSYYHYPSSSDFGSPAHRSLSSYFAPPVSYYDQPRANPPPYYAPPGSAAYPPRSPATSGLDVPLVPPALREAEREAPALIEVRVPAGAELWFSGAKMRQEGEVRQFQSPPLEPGKPYAYEVRARWTQGGKEVDQTRQVPVKAGAWSAVDFTR